MEDRRRDPERRLVSQRRGGNGQLLQMADEQRGYTLTDRNVPLAQAEGRPRRPRRERPGPVQSVSLTTNPAKHPTAKYLAAMQFIAWMTSPEGQRQIASFKVDGKSLFIPTAVPQEP